MSSSSICLQCSFHVASGNILQPVQDILPQGSPLCCLSSADLDNKIESNRSMLRNKAKLLDLKEAEIKLRLRKNDGHSGRVNETVLVWMQDVERLQIELLNQLVDLYGCEDQGCSSLHLTVDRNLLKLVREVDSLLETASSLPIYETRAIQSQADPFLNFAPSVLEQLRGSLRDPMTGIIGLYGVGGVGKSTIMKSITDQLANTEMFDKIFWVTLSKRVNWESVQDDIAKQLGIDLPVSLFTSVERKEMEKKRLQKLKNLSTTDRAFKMSEYLRSMKRCLFIFDDMWEPIPQDIRYSMILEPTEENGCKVVITTRNRSVCTEMGAHKQIYLAPLSQKEAWDLFVVHCGDHILDPNIQGIARSFVDECGGLPLNIITTGRAMRGKLKEAAWKRGLKMMRRPESEEKKWKLALKDIQRQKSQEEGTNAENFYYLRFCYNRLRNDQIRKCFLYCGVFPENYKFKSKELIGYWMAENYIYIKGDRVGSINMGKEILSELKDANMLELFVEDGNECFKMHGLFRELAINIARNEYSFRVEAGQKLTYIPNPHTVDSEHAKLISMIRNDIETCGDKDLEYQFLSTILLRDNPLIHISTLCFNSVALQSYLRFLDLSYTGITELPSSLCELTRLRVLFLGHCTSLKKIPSLKKLRELEVLNLSGTLIKEPPEGMKFLRNLKSLDLSATVRLENIQDGVLSSLSNLEELQMQGSRICKIDSPTVAARLKEIRFLKKLSILTLSAVGFGDHLDTILYLQGFNLKEYSINSYGTSVDYVEDF